MVEDGVQVDNSKFCAVLSYFVVGVLWYVVDEKMKSKNLVAHHARQAVALLLSSIIIFFALNVLSGLWGFIPVVGYKIKTYLPLAVQLLIFALWLMGIIDAANSKTRPLPVIGQFGKSLGF